MENDEIGEIELISVKDAAKILSLAPKTVYNRKAGTERLLRIRQGRTVQLLRSEVEAHRDERIREAEKVRKMIFGED